MTKISKDDGWKKWFTKKPTENATTSSGSKFFESTSDFSSYGYQRRLLTFRVGILIFNERKRKFCSGKIGTILWIFYNTLILPYKLLVK